MPRPILDPYRFPPFGGKIRFKRVRNDHQGVLYQNVEPQIGLPLWIRYNIPGKYWEYSIDADLGNFYRLKENPYIPDNAYFINRGADKPTIPAVGDFEVYSRYISGIPKLCVLDSAGTETILATGPAISNFPTGATAFWKLGETTGAQRNDSIGANNLTDHNSVTQIAGVVGNGAGFNGTTQYLDITDNADLSMGAGVSFEFTGWFKFTSVAGTQGIFGKDDGGAGQREYLVRLESSKFVWYGSLDGSTFGSVTANTFGALSTGVWYFLDVYYDQPSGVLGISVNRGTFDTAGLGTGGVFNGSAKFVIGQQIAGAAFLNGNADAVGLWKRILTSIERDNLYNSGAGLEP